MSIPSPAAAPEVPQRVPRFATAALALASLGGMWASVMGAIQRGWDGFLSALAAMYLALGIAVAWVDIRYGVGRLIVPIRVFGIAIAIFLWRYLIGSNSLIIDIVIITMTCAAAFFLTYWGETRADRWNRLKSRLVRLQWGDPQYALISNHERTRFRLFAVTWLLLGWFVSSSYNHLAHGVPVLTEARARPHQVRGDWGELKVGISLSGGGYRAALMHAGVLSALEDLEVPITHVSCVSGGAIIGAFYAAGGAPEQFLEVVERRSINLTRDLADMFNAIPLTLFPGRLPLLDVEMFPVASFSRTDVQANMLDHALFNGIRLGSLPDDAPELMICATDLRRAVALGFVRDGVWISSMPSLTSCRLPQVQAEPAFLSTGRDALPATARLATLATASGAFPGAFNSVPLDIPTGSPEAPSTERMQLADGGVFDNTGLHLMLDAHRAHRRITDFQARSMHENALLMLQMQGEHPSRAADHVEPLGTPWDLDYVIVSNGGVTLEAALNLSGLDEVMRAIDVLYACAGLRFLRVEALQEDGRPDVLVLGSSPFTARPAGWTRRLDDLVPALDELWDGVCDYLCDGSKQGVPADAASPKDEHESQEARAEPDPLTVTVQEAVRHTSEDTIRTVQKWRDLGRLPGLKAAAPASTVDETRQWIEGDVLACLTVFREASTLTDQFSDREADALYRLGRYFVALNWAEMRRGLTKAAESG